jgi:hypothetical protein
MMHGMAQATRHRMVFSLSLFSRFTREHPTIKRRAVSAAEEARVTNLV